MLNESPFLLIIQCRQSSTALRLLLKRNRRAAAQPLPRRRVSGFDRLARRRRRDRRGRHPSALHERTLQTRRFQRARSTRAVFLDPSVRQWSSALRLLQKKIDERRLVRLVGARRAASPTDK